MAQVRIYQLGARTAAPAASGTAQVRIYQLGLRTDATPPAIYLLLSGQGQDLHRMRGGAWEGIT